MDRNKEWKGFFHILSVLFGYIFICPSLYSQVLQSNPHQKVLGLGAIQEADLSSLNGYTLLRTLNGIYRIESDRTFVRMANSEGILGLHIAPDGNRVLVDFISGSDTVVDPMQWSTLLTLPEGEYPYDPFSHDSRNILYKDVQGIPAIFSISDNTNTALKEITDTKFVFLNDTGNRIYFVTLGEDEYTPNPYTHKYPYYLNEWDINLRQLISSKKMENVNAFSDDPIHYYSELHSIDLTPKNDVIAVTLDIFRTPSSLSHLLDFTSGKELHVWNPGIFQMYKMAISSNGRWVVYDGPDPSVGFIDTVNVNPTTVFSLGPYSDYTDSVFSADSGSALFRESTVPSINMAAAIDLVDLNTGSIKNHFTLLNQPVAKVDFTDNQKLAFLFGNHTYSVIHQQTGDLLVEGLGNRKHQDLIVLPDLNQLLLCAGSIYIFADFAQKKEL